MSKKAEAKKEPPKKELGKKIEESIEPKKEEEVKPEKPEKTAKREKKKKEEKGVFTYYKIENGKIFRQRPTCERCGSGYFMADHGNRYTCGHCGFTKYKHAENGHV